MNKFLTLAVLGLSSLSLAAAGTDNITTALIKSQHPEFDYSGTSYTATEFEDFSIVAESGAEYFFNQTTAGTNPQGDEFWALTWNHYGELPQGYMTSTKSGGYITKIEVFLPANNFAEIGYAPSEFEFYVSDQPMLTKSDAYDGTRITLTHNGNGSYTWNADGLYQYLYLNTVQEVIGNLAVTYSDNAPQIQVKTPYIECQAWDGCVPGSTVYIATDTEGATLHITTYIDSEEYDVTTVEQSYTYMELPGEPGQEVAYVVYATKEGYTKSDEAIESFDVVMPRLNRPALEEYTWKAYPGYELVYRCTDKDGNDIEGATLTYTTFYQNWDQPETNWRGETQTAALPLTIVVPDNVPVGGSFGIEGTAKAEGYRDSDQISAYFTIISTDLEAPYVSIPSGSEVKLGQQLQISRPENATEIHYVINGGEEIIVEDYYAYITLEEDCTIQIWATAPAPFKDSEVISVSYTIEKFGEWADVLYPTDFLEYDSSAYNGGTVHTDLSFTRELTGATYNYQGRLYRRGEIEDFYMNNKNDNFIFTTGTPKSYIKRFKIDADGYPYGACYILLLNEPFAETALTNEMIGWDNIPGRIRIGDDSNAEYGWGEWINLMSLKEVKGLDVTAIPHFVIYRYSTNGCEISRVCVEYLDEEELTGVEDITVDADNGVVEVYNLNGIRVDGENLAPGIYIRKANGKSEKFVVR